MFRVDPNVPNKELWNWIKMQSRENKHSHVRKCLWKRVDVRGYLHNIVCLLGFHSVQATKLIKIPETILATVKFELEFYQEDSYNCF